MTKLPSSQLDHLILLVPSLSQESLAFVSNELDIVSGGTHADGLTENVLISLSDGVYLELIAFCEGVDAERRAAHWWGRKKEGWIDWCLAPAPLSAKERVDALNGSAITYEQPVAGGRLNKQGQHIQWEVAFPVVGAEAGQRGVRPFFCEDKTARAWRVPERTSPHPNGASGISALVLLSKPSQLERYLAILSPILGSPPQEGSHQFELERPVGEGKIKVTVREAKSAEERAWVEERGEGLWEVHIKGGKGSFGSTEGARIVFE